MTGCAAAQPTGSDSLIEHDPKNCAFRFQQELAAWEQPDWEACLREKLKAVPGYCVLDMSEDNILGYSQGDWSLVETDVRCAFSPELAELILSCVRDEIQTCLAVRRELINFKKLCLHIWQAGSVVEKDLRQLTSFFFCHVVNEGAEECMEQQEPLSEEQVQHRRYVELAKSLQSCRGCVAALFDARHFSKAICAFPRHPDTGAPWKFESLPESLYVMKAIKQAQQFLANHRDVDAFLAARWAARLASTSNGDTGAGDVNANAAEAPLTKPKNADLAWKSERQCVSSSLGPEGVKSLLDSVATAGLGLPSSATRYLELVFISRGACKAVTIRQALRRYCHALRETVQVSEDILRDVKMLLGINETPASDQIEYEKLQPLHGTAIAAGLHLHCNKHQLMIEGMVPVMREMLKWLDPIAAVRADSERAFVSGSRGAAAFVPRGFPDLLSRHRLASRSGCHREAMLAALAPGGSGWPASARPAPGEEVHVQACGRCGEELTRLWLHRGLCMKCEGELRAEGRCPYGGQRCGTRTFCPHYSRCIVCEQWSCEECKLLRGDGEDVEQLVSQRAPAVVFLDFDRTLCTTKAGASPLQGNHSLDVDLVSVCSSHERVSIVTRSSRRADIAEFLRRHGVNARASPDDCSSYGHLAGNVCVRSVKCEGLRSKADVILEELNKAAATEAETGSGRNVVGLFADDDIKELTDLAVAKLADEGRLLRLLFVRSGGKE
eukprot:TRINITY_DN30578_c0_g1_i1.p1 TRINITY_DN30578_c0_g1~~TRINITY_DN30578_c0_g1_i1.p1  ORF type:complete len:725 (+),score=86.55 TRINITY_DN30578_c0_g1_i1:47-2221(+)